jgi:hypothetical protein
MNMKKIVFITGAVALLWSATPTPAADAPATVAAPTTNASPARTTDDVEFRIGPVYANAPELAVKPDVPKGTIHEFTMNSEESKIYPGIAKRVEGTVPYKRKVAVYVPSQYLAGTPAPFIVAQDGLGYAGTLPKVLDNLIHEKRVPVMIAIMINSGGGDAQGSERGLEYDTVSDRYTTFIETEVLRRFPVITTSPSPKTGRARDDGREFGRGVRVHDGVVSAGPLSARVELLGPFVNQQSPLNPESPHGAWEYHEHLIPQSERKPLRVWLEVSENDNGSKRDEASLHNWVMANERMAAALKAKGYSYCYVFAEAVGHTDGRVTRQTLPGALEWLWQGYARPPAAKAR